MTTSLQQLSYREALTRLTASPDDTQAAKVCAAALLGTGHPEVARLYLQLIGDTPVQVPTSWCIDGINTDKTNRSDFEFSKPNLIRLANMAMLTKHGNVLEIGCGTGYFSAILSAFGNEVYGIGLEPLEVDLARFRFYDLGLTCGHFRLATPSELTRLPDADSSFDFVVISDLLQKLPSPEHVLREASV